ncbi:syntaxin 6, N-terminal-domain-containing protein [Blastocladiella britannica]|nr:syntaxin 6, N-terminal-domain-containing protein [Blastocladiella britannica]
MQDPFDEVRASVADNLASARQLLSSWRATTTGPDPPPPRIRMLLSSIAADLDDLAETVAVVERDPARFRLSVADVTSRRQFVASSRSELRELNAALQSGLSAAESGRRAALMGASASGNGIRSAAAAAAPPSLKNGNQGFIDDEMGKQQLMMKSQDHQLDAVLGTVTNLKQVAVVMGDEIEDQIGLMNEMESDVDRTQDKLRGAMSQMDKIRHASNDTKATWLIVALTIVLVLLIVFILV